MFLGVEEGRYLYEWGIIFEAIAKKSYLSQ